MKPTRNIVTPTKGLWTTKHKPWFFKNDDGAIHVGINNRKATEEEFNSAMGKAEKRIEKEEAKIRKEDWKKDFMRRVREARQ